MLVVGVLEVMVLVVVVLVVVVVVVLVLVVVVLVVLVLVVVVLVVLVLSGGAGGDENAGVPTVVLLLVVSVRSWSDHREGHSENLGAPVKLCSDLLHIHKKWKINMEMIDAWSCINDNTILPHIEEYTTSSSHIGQFHFKY
jgi:hypothetical protein